VQWDKCLTISANKSVWSKVKGTHSRQFILFLFSGQNKLLGSYWKTKNANATTLSGLVKPGKTQKEHWTECSAGLQSCPQSEMVMAPDVLPLWEP